MSVTISELEWIYFLMQDLYMQPILPMTIKKLSILLWIQYFMKEPSF